MNRLIDKIRNISYVDANSTIRRLSGIVDYFLSEDEKIDFISTYDCSPHVVCEDKVSYGDWQTPKSLTDKICEQHLLKYGAPDIVIEPTCGLGSFVFSALEKFSDLSEIHALEINRDYTSDLKLKLLLHALNAPSHTHPDIYVYTANFFEFDFSPIVGKAKANNWNLAVIGNPPWVTNSRQGKANSQNIPIKQNRYRLKGIDAITGKSNFDISEYITLNLLELAQRNKGGISFLLKNSVIRNILSKQKINDFHIGQFEQGEIDASAEFNVSVDASCFTAKFNCRPSLLCLVKDFYTGSHVREYGWIGNSFVADVMQYKRFSNFDNQSSYMWRSGIKHDCAAVLELVFSDGKYINGLGEIVNIEDDLIFPLLKSSDINNYNNCKFRKFVIVPQHRVGEDTSRLEKTHPLTFFYLREHEEYFSKRKSCIYKNKDRFSVFGVGEYSFKPYKIAVSSLYKTINFVLVLPFHGKPVIVDDTCYQLDFDDSDEADSLYQALCSEEIQSLLKSLTFVDAKRVVTKSLLMRLDLVQLCNKKGLSLNTRRFSESLCQQLPLFD